MNAHWTVRVEALLGAIVLGISLVACSKTVTKVLEPAAKPPVVSSVKVSADQSLFLGECPGAFYFTGEIAVTDSSLVVCRWERSDGFISDPISLGFCKGTATVGTWWHSVPPGKQWARLHVLIPDDVASNQVPVRNGCVQLAAWATAQVQPPNYSGPCPARFDFSARISSNAATDVRYRWEGSDGHIGPEELLMFAGAGTQTVRLTRSMIPEGTFTERVHILAPKDSLSAPVSFTNACQGLALDVTVTSSPWDDPCYGIFIFYGQVATNASTVTYQWEYSDGGSGPIETLNFGAPGTQTVSMQWVPPTETAWARLHVRTPKDVTAQADVQYGCPPDYPCYFCDGSKIMREKGAQRLRAKH